MTSRLFVAVWPSLEAVDALARALEPLSGAYPELRWQTPDRWHITLAFLGDRDEHRCVERFGRQPAAAAGALQLDGSGMFGPVLWIGVSDSGWLATVASQAQRGMGSDERRFRGHVTVARSRTATGRRQLARAAADLASFRSPPWIPDEVTLVRSTTGPRPSYEVIARTPLTSHGP